MKSHAHRRGKVAARAILGTLAAMAMVGGIQASAGAAPASAARTVPAALASTALPTAATPKWMHLINLHNAYDHALAHVKEGKIAGITYRIGYHPKAAAAGKASASCSEPNCPLRYSNGQVEHTAHIYLLLWGPTWANDSGEIASAAYMQNFYGGLGVQPKDSWSLATSQYSDSTGFPTFGGSQFAGVFTDTSTPPAGTTQAQLTAEAGAFASSHNLTSNPQDDQVVIATQSGTCPQGFGAPCNGSTGYYCAYHTNDPTSGVTFTNMPYLLDAGAACGENFINPGSAGTYDGFSIVGGHEYAETITDPYPTSGWFDVNDTVSGGEIGDKCAWAGTLWGTPDPAGNVTLSTGTFAMQSLWSNAANRCVMAATELSVTNPGSQSTAVGSAISLQIRARSATGARLTYGATGLPAGLSINTSTGLIAGTPTTSGVSNVTVKVDDTTGASASASFTWTVNGVCRPTQVLKNAGFEAGRLAPWHATRGVLTRSSRRHLAHSGKWLALLQESIPHHTNYVSQKVTIRASCGTAKLSFWLKVATTAPRRRVFATLKAEILTPGGKVLKIVHTYTNRDSGGYRHYTFNLGRYAGKTIVVKFVGHDNLRGRTTSFLIDDTALRTS
jgi:hypothetical protein